MRALLLACVLCWVVPASAQLKVPDNLPRLPDDAASCNDKRTHCLVNYADWMAYQFALQLAAQRLVDSEATIAGLREALAKERASKTQRCASLEVVPRRITKEEH